MSNEVTLDNVMDAMFSDKPSPEVSATTQTRPTIDCKVAYEDDGTIVLRIPPATKNDITLSQKKKPMLTLRIPELNVTLVRGEGETRQKAIKTGIVPYGTVTVMVKL